MYQSISSVAVLDPPFSSIRCSFTHSFALRSFVCSLLAHCAKVHSGKRTKVSQRRGEKKGGKEVRLETERRRNERANVCPIGIHRVRCRSKESDNITYDRANGGQFSIFKFCVRSVFRLATGQPTTFCPIQFHSWARLGVRGDREKLKSRAISHVPAPSPKIMYKDRLKSWYVVS